MGCIMSEQRSSNNVHDITPPPNVSTSTPIAALALSAAGHDDPPPPLPHSSNSPPTAVDASPSVRQNAEHPETDAGREICVSIEKGSATELNAVLSQRQPSCEQLQEEPFCSMMYRAARAGHVEVMEKVYEWCGEPCLYWNDPDTGS
eukprot:RCo038160